MVGTSRSSAGPGARLHGAVQRVQRRPLRSAVGAGREAGSRAEGGASHRERGADAGERGAAAGRGDTGGVGAVVAGGGGLGRAAAGGSAGAGGVGGDERAGAARDVAGVGGWWGAIAGAMGMERGTYATPPVDLGWAHPPTLGCIFWIVGAHPPHPLPEGSPLWTPPSRELRQAAERLLLATLRGVEVPLPSLGQARPAPERRPFDRLRVSGIKV